MSARAIPPAPSTSDRRTANDGPDSRDAGLTTPARPATSRRANDRWTSGSYGRYGTPTSSSSPSARFVRAAAAATSGSPSASTSPSVQPVVGTARSSTTTTISWVGGRVAGRLSRRAPRTRQLPGSAGDRPAPTSTTSSDAASVSPRTSRKARVARRSAPARTATVTGRRGMSGGPPIDPGTRPSECLRTDPSAETGRGSSRELDRRTVLKSDGPATDSNPGSSRRRATGRRLIVTGRGSTQEPAAHGCAAQRTEDTDVFSRGRHQPFSHHSAERPEFHEQQHGHGHPGAVLGPPGPDRGRRSGRRTSRAKRSSRRPTVTRRRSTMPKTASR